MPEYAAFVYRVIDTLYIFAHSIVDENKCIGCAVCTTKCEFDAIHIFRERPECSTMRTSEEKLKYILPNGAKQGIKLLFKKKS